MSFSPEGFSRRRDTTLIAPFTFFARQVNFGQRKFSTNPGALAPSTFQLTDLLEGDSNGEPKTAVLLVSLGSHKTEGAQLDAIAQWASSHFDKIRLMPADYIYRLTLQLLNPELDEIQARRNAVQACNEFRAHASPILAQYSYSCEFEWFPMSMAVLEQQDAFDSSFSVLEKLLQSSTEFSDTVKHYSDAYASRVGMTKEGSTCDEDAVSSRTRDVARTYLMEECAIFAAMGEQEPTNLIYAGTIDSMIGLCEGQYPGAPNGFANVRFIEVKNERRGQFFPDGTNKILRTGSLMVGSFQRPTYSHNFLAELGPAGREKLLQYTKRKKFRTGQSIAKIGKTGNKLFKNGALYFVVSGRVEEFLTRACGAGQQRIGIVDVGAMIIERNFLDEAETNHFSAIPVVETEVEGLTKANFEKLSREEPELAFKLMRAIAKAQTSRSVALMHELQNMRLRQEQLQCLLEDSLTSIGEEGFAE